jgi:hypothetical protein
MFFHWIKNKKIILVFLGVITSTCFVTGQLVIDVSEESGYIGIHQGETFEDTSDIEFRESVNPYSALLLERGLHFYNKQLNVMDNDIIKNNLRSSPILGTHGYNTVVQYTGHFIADGGQSKSSLVLMDSARFVCTGETSFDLINDAFYGRPLWIHGDGTGILELKEDFIADLSAYGTVQEGIHSLRISDATLITHHTQNIPITYLPTEDPDSPCVYSHIYFENKGYSYWKILSNNQEYKGGLVIRDCILTIIAEKDLIFSGVKETAPGFTNWGGLLMSTQHDTVPPVLIKKGNADIICSGNGGFVKGSTIRIEQGTFEFQADPYTSKDNLYDIEYYIFDTAIHDQNLIIEVSDSGTIFFNTHMSRIDSIGMSDSATLTIGLGDTLSAKKAFFNGTLLVNIPEDIEINRGDTFNLFDIYVVQGNFNSIFFASEGSDSLIWNMDYLYSEGKIFVEDVDVSNKEKYFFSETSDLVILPNPFHAYLLIESSAPGVIMLYDINGKLVFSESVAAQESKIHVEKLPRGVYFYQFLREDNEIIASGKLLKNK